MAGLDLWSLCLFFYPCPTSFIRSSTCVCQLFRRPFFFSATANAPAPAPAVSTAPAAAPAATTPTTGSSTFPGSWYAPGKSHNIKTNSCNTQHATRLENTERSYREEEGTHCVRSLDGMCFKHCFKKLEWHMRPRGGGLFGRRNIRQHAPAVVICCFLLSWVMNTMQPPAVVADSCSAFSRLILHLRVVS